MDIIALHGGASNRHELHVKVKKFAEEAFEENSALDAVIKAVQLMEDDPDFNAGTGSNIRIDGSIQMDAAVMIPNDFGAVVGIERVKNPVMVARDVMLHSPHMLLAGDGAVNFARKLGYEEHDPRTPRALSKRERVIEKLKNGEIPAYYHPEFLKEFLCDTVGAVAYMNGTFAAAVSTGGTSLTLRGRVGDSPIPGAGIYAGENGAIVATGIGEEIIRRMLAINLYRDMESSTALESVCKEHISHFGDIPVGVIAITREEGCALSNLNMPKAIITRNRV